MHYSTFVPKPLRGLYNWYYKGFIRRRLRENKKTSFAVGLLSPGILESEPVYTHPKELEKDLLFLKKQGVRNVVVFRLGSFLERKKPEEWLAVIKKYAKENKTF